MTCYSVQVAVGGIMRLTKDFDSFEVASRFFTAISRGRGTRTKEVWLVRYDGDDLEGCELAYNEVKEDLADVG